MESRLQPCFNSNAIETYLHQIDTQSDYMVFMCDDYLFGSRTELCDFITPDGRLKVFGTWLGEYFPWRIRADRWVRLSWLLGLGDLEHTPHFIYKPWYREMYESRPRDLAMTRRNRFRTPGELKRIYLNNVFLLSHKRSEVDVVPGKELLAYHRLHMIKGPLEKEVAAFQKLRELSLKFYCLNDDMGPDPDPKVVAMILAYLNDMYPTPSRWEKS